MPELIVHQTLDEFKSYNRQFIADNCLACYTLAQQIERSGNGEIEIKCAFNITDADGSFLSCLFFNHGELVIYCTKWNANVVTELCDFTRLSEAPNDALIFGEKNLVLEIAKHTGMSFEVIKDRIIYECKQPSATTDVASGAMSVATVRDLKVVAQMAYDFSKDEYKENAFRSFEYMSTIARNGIASQTIFKLTIGNEIVSIAQVLNPNDPVPVIGQFFTKSEFRSKGYGTSLLKSLTQRLLKFGYKSCGLIADAKNDGSNIVFRRCSYEVVSRTIKIAKVSSD